jgi:hypothetical protein
LGDAESRERAMTAGPRPLSVAETRSKEEHMEATGSTQRSSLTMVGPIAGLAAVAAAALANLGNLTSHTNENGGVGDFVSCALIALVLTAVLFGWALPRWHGSQRAPVVLALLAVLSLGAFWAGVPEVIAPAAIVAALTAEKRTLAQKGAIVVATLALLAGVVAALVG